MTPIPLLPRRLLPTLWTGWICLALSSLTAVAAGPRIVASVDPVELRPGGYAAYTISFENGRPDEIAELQLPNGLENASPHPSQLQQVTNINGTQQSSYVLTWQITANEPGEYIIPPQEFHVGGVPYQSNDVRVVVTKNPAYPVTPLDPIMTIQVEKKKMYVGEVVPVTVFLYVHFGSNATRLGLIEMPKDSFAVQRFPLQPEEDVVTMGGQKYRALIFRSTLSGLKPGKLKLGPASMELQVAVSVGGTSNLNPFFGMGPTEIRKFKPQCNEIELTVDPLPTEGRPADFSGAVGDFQIASTADPKQLALGDPIDVEMTISGTGNFDAITPPVLTDSGDWKLYPARRYSPDGNISANIPAVDGNQLAVQRLGFSQIIIPKKRLEAIPPFEFSFFSPSKKKYVTLLTEATPIKVTGVEASPDAGVVSSSSSTSAPDEAEKVSPPKANLTDILTFAPGGNNGSRWLAASRGLWDDRFLMTNMILCGVLLFMVAAKLGYAALVSYQVKAGTPQRVLWRKLHQHGLSRTRFYELAATYIQNYQATSESLPAASQSIVDRHLELSFANHPQETDVPITEAERSQIMKTLRSIV